MERRRSQGGQTPIETLRQVPALVLLERLPVAALAIADDGAIVFGNTACADMLGYTQEELNSLNFKELLRALPSDISAVAAVNAFADVIVELKHRDDAIIRARMSKSALLRGDDPVALATFQDLTEQLWVHEL